MGCLWPRYNGTALYINKRSGGRTTRLFLCCCGSSSKKNQVHSEDPSFSTARCRYNVVNFPPNPHDKHLIAPPWGVSVVILKSDLLSATVVALSNVISWQIESRFKGTLLYMGFHVFQGHVNIFYKNTHRCRDYSVYGHSQWETTLQCNAGSYRLSPYTG